jgi:thiol:disulfide interchange protein DsbD
MIPMTVSYFMKSGSNGKIQASIYGFSIIAIYTLFGTLVAVLFGAEFSNWISTHWIPNVLFFLIFVIFGASFFGYFEITMPNWLVNKSVSAEDKGGTIGTVFMAFTLVLVSFSCTGPIVGTILVESVGGQILKPIIGMLGFSLAFAIPFTLFALFPQWLNKLPKSGGWLNTVKVVLGFIELAFALKFLNIPDQTYHWGILDREIYLGFWIVIFTMMGFYLLGKIKFPHDSDYPVVRSFPRLMLIIATFTFVIYLIPGLWGAPLKGISGWLPPMETQDFDVTAIVRDNSGSGGTESKGNIAETPKYLNTALKLPHGLKGYFDYDEALKASKVLNKPVFVDFTGHGCTNCREMENRVWSDPQVLKRLRENFVIAALYVDDKVIEMPKDEWYTNKAGREVKLLGKKNAEIQIDKFGQNAQPFYVILDGDGNSLVTPHAYDLDIASYVKFLDDGVAAFNKKKDLK